MTTPGESPIDPDVAGRVRLWADVVSRPGDPSAVMAALASVPTGGSGALYIDPERAEECIRALKAVALDLTAARMDLDLTTFPPPGIDEVSVNMANQAGIMARRAYRYIDTWRAQVLDTVAALEQQLAAYRAVEGTNASRLT